MVRRSLTASSGSGTRNPRSTYAIRSASILFADDSGVVLEDDSGVVFETSARGWPPHRLFRLDQLHGELGHEAFDPLRHLEHPGFFRDRVPEQDDALGDAERGRVERVRLAVEGAVALLLLAADEDVDVGGVDRRRGVADTRRMRLTLALGSPTTRSARAPLRRLTSAASAPSVVSGMTKRCDPADPPAWDRARSPAPSRRR